jgi:hypothetical protein
MIPSGLRSASAATATSPSSASREGGLCPYPDAILYLLTAILCVSSAAFNLRYRALKPDRLCFWAHCKKPLELHTFHGTTAVRQWLNLRVGKTIQEDFAYDE